jgi:hypothetical protein
MSIDAGEELKPRTLYTGLEDCKIIAINPTIADARKLGIKLKDDYSYFTEKEVDGVKSTTFRVEIYLMSSNLEYPVKLTLFFEDKDQVASTGKFRFINDFGQNTYSESAEACTSMVSKSGHNWFKADGIRVAKVGECELIEFIKAWLSIGLDAKAKLDNVSKMIKSGDVTELTGLRKKYADRKVQVLLTVRENDGIWYQGVYGRFFSRGNNNVTKYWENHLSNSTNPPVFQSTFKLKEFDPMAVSTDSETPAKDEANPWS